MALPIDLTGKPPIIGGSINTWGIKLNAIDQELADGVNELYDDINGVGGIISTLATKAPINNPTFTGTVGGITQTMVGLANVTNESKSTMFTNPSFTGNATATTPSLSDNDTSIATTAFVKGVAGNRYTFDTIADAQAYSEFIEGDIVETLGFANKNDGSGGKYVFISTNTISSIPCIGGFLKLDEDVITPSKFLGTNYTEKFQNAINLWEENYNKEIFLEKEYIIDGTIYVKNIETETTERKLIIRGGRLTKNNAGFMFDKKVGEAQQTGHIFFEGVNFKGANLNAQTFILNGENIIRTHFNGCFGQGINIIKSATYIQTIYIDSSTTWRKWTGYAIDVNYLFDVKIKGIFEHGDAVLKTRDANADPACNSLELSGCIEGLNGTSGRAIDVGVCFSTSIHDIYCEHNNGGDFSFNGGTGYHKGLTIESCGFQPNATQLADPDYFPVITGKGAEDSITLIGNSSTHNLFDVTIGNESAIFHSGNFVASGKKLFSDTSNRLTGTKGTDFTVSLTQGYGVSLKGYDTALEFLNTLELLGGIKIGMQIANGETNPQTSPQNYGNRYWRKGTIVFNSAPNISLRQYGAGVVHDALILGWICMTSGSPGTWREIPILLPY